MSLLRGLPFFEELLGDRLNLVVCFHQGFAEWIPTVHDATYKGCVAILMVGQTILEKRRKLIYMFCVPATLISHLSNNVLYKICGSCGGARMEGCHG